MLEVDPKGLAKLLERKGPEWLIFELVQNAWDTNSESCHISIEAVPGKPRANISVMDEDPDGFKNLSHAWTLFAESEKKDDPEKRGRFNLGEKLVLAYVVAHGGLATVMSTTGTVSFSKQGRTRSRQKTLSGSAIELDNVKLTRDQLAAVLAGVRQLIPPERVKTVLHEPGFSFGDGEVLTRPRGVLSFPCTLPTEVADEEGILRRTRRKTVVTVLEPRNGETGWVYEMGIPVVETGDRWHVDVSQKIPLNMDRDNVTPAYLRQLRTEVLNHTATRLTEADANAGWVREAAGYKRAEDKAVTKVMDLRFGTKRVGFDPSDPEGTKLAVSRGFAVVHGGSLSKGEWYNVRRSGSILPAGQVTPSKKVPTSPDGKPPIPRSEWTTGMERVAAYSEEVAKALIGRSVTVEFYAEITWPWGAAFTRSVVQPELVYNKGKLGNRWFDRPVLDEINELLIHELAHQYSGDHLSSKYHDALCRLGAKLASWAAIGRMESAWETGR